MQYLLDNISNAFDNENNLLIFNITDDQKARLTRIKKDASLILTENGLNSANSIRRRSTFVLNNSLGKNFNIELYSSARKSSIIEKPESPLFKRKDSITPSIPPSPPAGSPPIGMLRYKQHQNTM